MSELKARRAYFSEDEYDRGTHKICAKVSDCGYDRRNDWWSYAFEDEVYIKSEADKVIAELKEKLKVQTLNAEEGWKEFRTYYTSYAEAVKALYDKNKELRHHKYKRCLAMAWWCNERIVRIEKDYAFWRYGKDYAQNFYKKWKLRWLELAEKFKPNSTAQ